MLPNETLEVATERQKEIERESVTMGAARYRGSHALPWQDKARGAKEEAELAPGMALLRANVEAVAEGIVAFLEDAHSGRAGRKHTASKYLLHIDPLQAAYLALRNCLNTNMAGDPLVSRVASRIGSALEEHIEMVQMAEEHPGLYRKVTRQLASSTSATHRLGVFRHVRDKYNLSTLGWSRQDKILVGVKLVELVVERTALFQMQHVSRGKHDRPLTLSFTPETLKWLEEAHGRCELLSPIHLPMVAPPRPWRTPYSGGYLTAMLRPKLVRSANRDYLSELGGVDLSRAGAAVNAVQDTPWRINRKTLEVMLADLESGGGTAGLPRGSDLPLPPRPSSLPEDTKVALSALQKEDLLVWKAKAAKVHAANSAAAVDRIVLAQKLYVAQRFQDEERLWFPHFLDFRGRVYPFASYLNPQSDDTGRGLLEFAEGKPLGEDGAFWLAVHLAGLWGVDKVSFEERVAWVTEHEEAILQSALSPHEDNAFWREAEKPWQALAACFDWLGYALKGSEHVSHTPIAMDGSCSGLQHYSALLRDPIGGAAVNLVPADKPADVYTAVAAAAQAISDGCTDETIVGMVQAWQGKFCRKVAKQPTMTLCYSATKYGWRQQIESALKKLDEDGPYLDPGVDRFQAALYASGVIEEALAGTVVAAKRAMWWLQIVSQVVAEANIPLRWTSPIGLPILQDYRERNETFLKAHVGGKAVQFVLKTDSEKRSKRRQGSGVAPNFVHSLDAAHLLSTVNLGVLNGLSDFAVIHDSFATHACNTTLLNVVLRESFVSQYEEPVLQRFIDEVATQVAAVAPELVDKLPPLPDTGTLDLSAVRDSEFFFA